MGERVTGGRAPSAPFPAFCGGAVEPVEKHEAVTGKLAQSHGIDTE